MAAAQTNQPTEIYNMYEEGYRTGAQVSIFIGPIWIEEVVTLEKRTQSGDQPVYPYSSPYYSRLMLGKYKIYGHIGIAYTSTNYLLEIMERARNISIQDSELEEIINRQKNLFQNRLEHRIQNASRAQQIAESYVERISREIEIMGPGGSGIDPREFELTIIRGNLYNQDQSIDIYQDVKIVGTAEQISNDDGVQIELYSYIAKRKPPKNIRRDAAAVRLGLSRDNLLQMTQELTTGLVSSLLTPPSVSVFSVPFRSAKMFNTDRLAMAGIMNDKARFFGKRASFTEVVYAFELKQQFRSNDTGTVPAPLRSQAKLKVVREGVANELDGVYLQPPRKDHGIYFDNSYGKLVAMDREYTAKGITAIGPVTPQPLVNRMGGSICMPRYRRNEFDAGSFIPPQIVQEKDQYIYNDTQLDALTKTTMWNALVGYRGISKSSDNNTNSVESEEESGPSVITEIAQPLVTFAYIDHVKGTFNASGHDYVLEIGAPVYVDYMDTHRKGSKGKATKEELSIGKTDKTVKYTFNRGATEAVESVETTESAYSEYFKDTVMGVFYKEVELGDPLPETPDISHFNPVIFKITDSIDSARLATDFNKCMYVVPFVFIENDTVTVSHGAEHTAVCERETTGENFAPSWYDSNNRKIELLTHFMETREQRDATCDIDFTYDWIVTDASGLSSQGAQFSISGVAFLNPKNNDHTKVRCPECGLELTRESLGIGKKKAHVFFLMMVVPIVRTESDSSSNQQNGVTILHDLDTASGRYMELYNIIRCDVQNHAKTAWYNYNPDGSYLQSIWNAILWTFNELITVFTDSTEYMMPTRQSMDYIAGFDRQYTAILNVKEIIEQVLKSTFTGEDAIPAALRSQISSSREPITLKEAISFAAASHDGEFERTVVSVIVKAITDAIESQRLTVVKKTDTAITFTKEVLIPAPHQVCLGFTEDGYNELMNSASSTPGSSITRGGYSAN